MNSIWDAVGTRLFNWIFLPMIIGGAFTLSITWALDGARPQLVKSSLFGFAMLVLFLAVGYRHYFLRGMQRYFYAVFCLPLALSTLLAIVGLILR